MLLMPHKLRRGAAASFTTLAFLAHPAAAQMVAPVVPVVTAPRFLVKPVPAGLVVATSGALYLTAEVFKSDLPYATCAPCDASKLPGIDRGILGPVRPGVSTVSDATLMLTVAGSAALLYADPGTRAEHAEDLAVWTEAMSVSSAALVWTKVLFHRPRPILYTSAAVANATPDNGLSFPSGHASLVFAAAAAYAEIEHRRGRHAGRRGALAGLIGTAATTALLRVVARRHFPTDVMAGAVLGSATGWLVPAIYPMQ